MAERKAPEEKTIDILEVNFGGFDCCILGRTPLIMNSMSEKVARGLLCPPLKKTPQGKASSLKHDPLAEFLGSAYMYEDSQNAPTRLCMPAVAFKSAMRSVALDMPSTKKAEIGRLTYVEGQMIPIFGTPQVFMSNVRTADAAHTPDIRTRVIMPEWACKLSVVYTRPILKEQAVANLLGAAGLLRGVGDWRTEKGSSNYGQFTIVAEDDPRWNALVKKDVRKAQDAALIAPEPHDLETERLLVWFYQEVKLRGFKDYTPWGILNKYKDTLRKGGIVERLMAAAAA